MVDIRTAIAWAEKGHDWEPRFRAWLLPYLETGQCPAFESLQPTFDDADDELQFQPSAGERLNQFLSRFRRLR